MWKLIFWGIVFWIAFQLVKRNFNANKKQPSAPQSQQDDNVENMVKCDQCHVHLPRSEAFLVNGKFYCSKAHINTDAP